MLTSEWTFTRQELEARHGAVVAHHKLAAEAGREMLRRGGNAVDAAVAAAFVMSVVEPFMSGIGGGGYMVVHLAERRETLVVDFGMKAPLAAHAEMFGLLPDPAPNPYTFRKVKGDANKQGPTAATTPGVVAGLCLALERFGTLPRETVLAPAITLAADGFPMHWFLALCIYNQLATIRTDEATAAVFLKGDGTFLAPLLEQGAETLVQAELAQTLRQIAEGGAAAFYRGPAARTIAAYVQAHGGCLAENDFVAYEARVVKPLVAPYGGHEVMLVPDVSAGATVAQTLNLLDALEVRQYGHNSADALHLIAEAGRRAFVDRYAFYGDPEQAQVPYEGLLSKGYAQARAAEISLERATPDVRAGDPWPYGPVLAGASWQTGRVGAGAGDTTHISVADEARNLVSLTQTASSFMVPGTGVMMNLGMKWFDPEPGHPNSIASGKRLLMNMSPLLLLCEGRPFAALGSPGARRIPNALAQTVLNLVDYGLGIQDAVGAPKLDCSTPRTLVDDRIPEGVRAELTRRGHPVQAVHEDMGAMSFARPNGVLVDHEAGTIRAGSYPYFHGVAAGL
jgi:gamma-glutamyltranspeptidase/glutathione hydrolase